MKIFSKMLAEKKPPKAAAFGGNSKFRLFII
jgi:hypothetical protein